MVCAFAFTTAKPQSLRMARTEPIWRFVGSRHASSCSLMSPELLLEIAKILDAHALASLWGVNRDIQALLQSTEVKHDGITVMTPTLTLTLTFPISPPFSVLTSP